MKIVRIRVPSRWYAGDAGWDMAVAEFKTGPGPCGLTVTSLAFEVSENALHITQQHENAGPKWFIYPLAQLTGRIEVATA